MPYLYHAIPRNMTGTVLYPLNRLREFDKALYEAHAAKYQGRERLTEQRIPLLGDCLWNDVLFLTAVHPAEFRKAFESAGYVRPRPFRAFQFDVSALDHACMAVMFRMQIDDPREYEPFDPARLDEYSTIPQATREYWRKQKATGEERPFLYLHIPHILYRGILDTAIASVVAA